MKRKIESFVPYGLPVLGGLLGVIYVNLFKFDFINPVAGIGIGALLGWLASRIVLKMMRRRR